MSFKTVPTKKLSDLRILFMGTPEFAVSSLSGLLNAGCNIVAVVTAPDKAAGRGLQVQQSAVKKFAEEKKLNILQPEKLKNPAFIECLTDLNIDLGIVVAFRMLPEIVWNLPPMGTINLHGSLLPQYRGAAPINWAIINGEKETGVTTFKLKHEIDTGDILLQENIIIGADENAGELHDRMKEIGANLLVKTVEGLSAGILQEQAQLPSESIQHAPKIFTETCAIDWNKQTDEVYNLIRGLSPYPAAFTQLDGKKLKVYASRKIKGKVNESAGKYMTDQKTYLRFVTADGMIDIIDLQLEGKKRMNIADFLRGFRWQ